MPNEHLKTALAHAGLTTEEFADIISVDPKTVQRWVSGRTPYARHRATISRALDLPEHELWPDDVAAPAPSAVSGDASAPGQGNELVGAWGHSNRDGAPDPVSLLARPVEEVDLLDAAGTLLRAPGTLAALRRLAADGCAIRVINSGHTLWPTAELDVEQIQPRLPPADAPDLIVLRADDTMLVALPLGDDQAPPLLALQRGDAGAFDRLADRLSALWDSATPRAAAVAPDAATPSPAFAEPPARDSEPPRRWPRRPPG